MTSSTAFSANSWRWCSWAHSSHCHNAFSPPFAMGRPKSCSLQPLQRPANSAHCFLAWRSPKVSASGDVPASQRGQRQGRGLRLACRPIVLAATSSSRARANSKCAGELTSCTCVSALGAVRAPTETPSCHLASLAAMPPCCKGSDFQRCAA